MRDYCHANRARDIVHLYSNLVRATAVSQSTRLASWNFQLRTQTMSVVGKNWQTTRPTIRERSKFTFNNDLFSDVKFVIKKTDDKNGSKQVIPAHKFVLSISSPVFEAMFYGKLAEITDSIELPDCEYDNLLELFHYMYNDEANVGESNVMGVLYLVKKYMVP